MIVTPKLGQTDINVNENNELNYKLINSVKHDELIQKTDINNYKRRITIVNSNAKLQYLDIDIPEDYILVENFVVHDKTPLAFDYFYQNIDKSFISSTFLFVRKTSKDVVKNKNDLYLLYGISNGYGIYFGGPELNWISYGISVLDKVNEFSSGNVTYTFDKKGLFDQRCEYLGSIYPNIYTEDHYEFLTNKQYRSCLNPVKDTYKLADLIDDKTEINHVNFNSIYLNQFEPEGDFYSMDNFMHVCFLFLTFNIKSIDVIYDSVKGINCKNIVREINQFKAKTSVDMVAFVNELTRLLKKALKYYSLLENNNDFIVMISVDESIYGITIRNKKNNKQLIIKISKAEMLEKILSNFYLNKQIVNEVNRTLLLTHEEKYFELWGETITFNPENYKNDLLSMKDFKSAEDFLAIN